MAEARKQVAKKTPARKAAKATSAKTPAKNSAEAETAARKTTPRKVAAAARSTRSRGTARTSASPAEVEDAAVAQAQPRRRSLDPNRPAARAARAMRGEPDPEPAAETDPATVFAETVDRRVEELRAQARAEQTPDGQPADPDGTVRIPFQGRDLLVRLPSEEQLTMYRRVSREFAALGKSGRAANIELDEALKYLDRAVRTVQSVLVEDDDREWIEDLLMDGRLKLVDCTALMQESFRRLAEKHGNRESRRNAGRQTAATLED